MPKSSTPNSQLDRLQERELARGLVKNDFIQDDVSDDDEEEIYITPNAVHKVGAVKDDEESEGASEPENADDFDDNDAENKENPNRRFLQCPGSVTVQVLKKLIMDKYSLDQNFLVDVIYKEDLLPEDNTLIDVAYSYNWRKVNIKHKSFY